MGSYLSVAATCKKCLGVDRTHFTCMLINIAVDTDLLQCVVLDSVIKVSFANWII